MQFITKKTVLAAMAVLLLTCLNALAQDKSSRPSPPATATGTINGAKVTVNYSQPSVKGRTVWGGIVPYGAVWRTGANEATTIEFSKDVKIEGQTLPAGKYALFTIPTEKDWTVIFNKEAKQWGAFNYKQGEDILRVTAKPMKSKAMNEKLLFTVGKDVVTMLWENMEVSFSIK